MNILCSACTAVLRRVPRKQFNPIYTSAFFSTRSTTIFTDDSSTQCVISPQHERELDRRHREMVARLSVVTEEDRLDRFREVAMIITHTYDFAPENMQRYVNALHIRSTRKKQMISDKSIDFLGSDLSVAHMVLNLGGAVQLSGSDQWIRKEKNKSSLLPRGPVRGFTIDAIDLTGTHIMYEGMQHFNKLKHLKALSLKRCPFVVDHCMTRINKIPNLMLLDLSSCLQLSARGLSALSAMKQLRRLLLHRNAQIEDKELVTLMLEEYIPEIVIEGIDFFAPLPEKTRQAILAKAADPDGENTNSEASYSSSNIKTSTNSNVDSDSHNKHSTYSTQHSSQDKNPNERVYEMRAKQIV